MAKLPLLQFDDNSYLDEAKPAQPAEHPQAEDDFQGDGTHVSQLHRCWL